MNRRVIGLGLLLMGIVFAVALIESCTHSRLFPFPKTPPSVNQTPYDWSNLQRDNKGRLSYIRDGKTLSRTGIDVSSHQQTIDWGGVAQDSISFAYIRIGFRGTSEGSLSADSFYEQNIAGAKAAGLDVGVYFYSQAITEDEAREEARFVLQQLNGQTLDYPVAYDLEPSPDGGGRADNLSQEQATALAKAFCDEIRRGGYRAIVYGNAYDLSRYDLSTLSENIWLAQYDGVPDGSISFVMWQYTSKGEVNGISRPVDITLDLSDVAQLASESQQHQ